LTEYHKKGRQILDSANSSPGERKKQKNNAHADRTPDGRCVGAIPPFPEQNASVLKPKIDEKNPKPFA
jgi:hypothetical protein